MDTWIVLMAAAMRSEELHGQKLLITKIGGRFLITGKDYPLETRHNDFGDRREKNPGYLVIAYGLEECPILVPSGS